MWLELFLVVISLFGYMSWKQKKSKEFWYERGVPNTNEERNRQKLVRGKIN